MATIPTSKASILLAEDDSNLSFVIKDNLERRGYRVTACKDGMEALDKTSKDSYDIMLMDIMMPKVDGLMVAEKVRMKNQHVPIIFISAKSLLNDKLAAFKVGADDYLIKPFSMDELLFKIEVFLRRSMSSAVVEEAPKVIGIGKYQFDFSNLTLTKDKEQLSLTIGLNQF